jgi:hypothetical protein
MDTDNRNLLWMEAGVGKFVNQDDLVLLAFWDCAGSYCYFAQGIMK